VCVGFFFLEDWGWIQIWVCRGERRERQRGFLQKAPLDSPKTFNRKSLFINTFLKFWEIQEPFFKKVLGRRRPLSSLPDKQQFITSPFRVLLKNSSAELSYLFIEF
jgi:hypothetical protein